MGGLQDLLAESEDRWSRAERRADGVADKGLGKAVRTYFSLYLPAAVVLLFVIGAGIGMLLFQGEWADVQSHLFAGTMLAGIGAIAAGHHLQCEGHFFRSGNGQNECHDVTQPG